MRACAFGLGIVCGFQLTQVSAAWSPVGEPVEESAAPGNVVVDPSFEEGQWRAEAGAAIAAEGARSGKSGARIERSDDKTDPRVVGPAFPAGPGRWLASGWLRTRMSYSADPGYSAALDLTWLDEQGTRLATERVAAVNGITHVWMCRERVVEAPPGTMKGELTFHFSLSATGLAELDDLAVTPVPAGAETGPPVEISLRAVERIFEPGQPLAVSAEVRLSEGPVRPVRLTMEVVDSLGKRLTTGAAECEARPDRSTTAIISAQAADVPLREHLVARVNTDPPQEQAEGFGLLVIPRPTDFSLREDSPFGLLVGHPYTKRWLGARWERPNFNWNEREMELAKRYGVNYVGMINEANRALRGEMSLEEYGAYVEESVRRFRHLVKYWELGNEPNLYQPGIPERWAEILRVGYEAAKRADPGCKVMWGGITGLNVDPDMVDKLLSAGGGDYTDIIDVHLYVSIPEMDRLLTKVRADMAKHGVDKPIVCTEMTGGLGTVLPEREKASYVYKRYAVAESHGLLASWWFVMHWVNTGEHRHCSLIDPGTGEPHEGAAAYARLTEALEGAEFVERLDCGENAWVYRWRKGDRAVYVAWAEPGAGRATLPCGSGAGTVTDVAGHQWPLNAGGPLTIDLWDDALLLDLPAGEASPGERPAAAFVSPWWPESPDVPLSRGGTARVGLTGVRGDIVLDAPEGLTARLDGEGVYLSASPVARLAEQWLVAREREGGEDTAFLRLPITVGLPLELSIEPVPGPEGLNHVNVEVTNWSGQPLAGTLTVVSPISAGLRPLTMTQKFDEFENGTELAGLFLPAQPDPLARYEFEARVETAEGVRGSLRRVLVFTPARYANAVPKIDGKLDEWTEAFPIIVGPETGERRDPQDGPPTGPDDLSARAAMRWDYDNLYLAVLVRDDVHNNERDGAIWDGDSLQLGFAPEPYVAHSPFYEWGMALTEEGVQAWSWRALPRQPTGQIEFPCKIVRSDGETVYEAAIPWEMLAPIQPDDGDPNRFPVFGFGLCVNEKDTADRGYYGWHAGIAGEKDRTRFGQVTLVSWPAPDVR